MDIDLDHPDYQLSLFALALRLARRGNPNFPRLYEIESPERLTLLGSHIEKKWFSEAKSRLLKAQEAGVTVVSFLSDTYPSALKTISGPPELLWIRGKLKPKGVRIAIVGSRTPSRSGKDFAERLAEEITASGGEVISGLAFGCDISAHRGAVKAAKLNPENSPGIAVLGSGVLNIYPTEHEGVVKEILDFGGAVISEVGLYEPPIKSHFPARNRIISGLSLATVVVEAAEKSGSLVTARFAGEQGRDVYSLPGCISSYSSAGTNRLLKDGARPITEFSDLAEYFSNANQRQITRSKISSCPILRTISREVELTFDELCSELNATPQELIEKLSALELKGDIAIEHGRIRFVGVAL